MYAFQNAQLLPKQCIPPLEQLLGILKAMNRLNPRKIVFTCLEAVPLMNWCIGAA